MSDPTRPHALLETEESEPRFISPSTYHLQCNDPSLTIGTARHGYEFTAAIASRNVMGVPSFTPRRATSLACVSSRTYLIKTEPVRSSKLWRDPDTRGACAVASPG